MDSPLFIPVILGTARQGRESEHAARFIFERTKSRAGVETELIDKALDALGIAGRTTGEITKQGNIRSDMFQRLLTADLVIADVSEVFAGSKFRGR